MRYSRLGNIPAKRHVQVRANGSGSPLLVEEVMGYEGFSGNESILLHLQSPCRLDSVGEFRPIQREEWVPDAHVHRLADANGVEPDGDPVSGRRLLMWNNDIEVSVCKPLEALDGFYRNGEGDEVIYIHRGSGVLRTIFGQVPFRERDYVVIPRGTTHTFDLPMGEEQFWLCFHTPGEIETPNRYRNRYGQLLEHAPFSQRDFHPPEELETFDESGEFHVTVRVRDGFQELRARPPSVRRGRLGRLRVAVHLQRGRLRAARRPLPPTAAGPPDLPGAELRDLHVRAAHARLGPGGRDAAVPPLEHPVRGGHVLRGRQLRVAQGRGPGLHHPAPVRPAARAAARRGRERARQAVHRRAGDHVGHVPAAPPVHALGRGGQAGVRLFVESGEDRRRARCTCRRTDHRSRSAPGRARSSTRASRGRTPGRRPPREWRGGRAG